MRKIGPYYFNSIGLDEVIGTELAKFAMDDSGAKRFASITVNNPFGIGIEIWSKAYVEQHGGEVVTMVRYDERKPDYRAEIERLFSKKPEDTYSEWVWDLPLWAMLAIAAFHLVAGILFVWSAGHFIEGWQSRR